MATSMGSSLGTSTESSVATSVANSIEELLFSDDQFTPEVRSNIRSFLDSDFDPQKYSREILNRSNLSLTENLTQIESSIAALENSLKSQILENPENLTENISKIEIVEKNFEIFFASSSHLLSETEAVSRNFREIFDEFSNGFEVLEKSKKKLDFLRKINRLILAAKRFRIFFSEEKENFAKAASVLAELGAWHKHEDFLKLKFLEEDCFFVQKTVESFPKRIDESLVDAITRQDLAKMGVAIDACLILGNVEEVLDRVTEKFVKKFQGLVEDGLDIQQLAQSDAGKNTGAKSLPGRTTLPSVQNSPALRTAFWMKIDAIFDAIYQNQIRIELLESVYLGRYEQHSLFSLDFSEIENGKKSFNFFEKITKIFENSLIKCGKDSSFLQQILENEFPRLLKMLKDTTNRLRSASLFLNQENFQNFREKISNFQSFFVSRSLSRLLEPVNNADAGLPSDEDLNNYFRNVTNELILSNFDQILTFLICGNVAKSLRLIFVKLENAISTDPEATQVTANLTPKQIKNFKIIDTAFKVKFGVEKILKEKIPQNSQNSRKKIENSENFGKKIEEISENSRKKIEEILADFKIPVENVLNPLKNSLLDSVESILLTMHTEDFSAGADDSDTETIEVLDSTCSPYMRELQEFLSRIQETFFSKIDISKPFLRFSVAEFGRKCLELFVRHASLVRPVGKNGRLRLAGDFAQLESALANLNLNFSDFGKELLILKNFRSLLFQSPQQISQNPNVGGVVPTSVALHHLFSRAPAELQSPFKVSGWSISRYSRFLDENSSEKERLLLINSCLDSYAQSVRDRGETHYAVIYPLMKEMLAKVL